jgi:protein ImuB
MKRVMCVYLSRWPIQRLEHNDAGLRGLSLALVKSGTAKGKEIALCSERAEGAGVRAGMPAAEASAVDRSLQLREQNPEADVLALGRLAKWLERFTPIVAIEDAPAPQALLLDITGCAPCFHGEDQLLQRAVTELAQQGWTARVAIADTVGAAWALAHYGRTPCLIPTGATEQALQDLPVAALRLPAEALELLSRLRIDRIGTLSELPRADIPSRFGAAVLKRLDQALGRVPEVLTPHRPPPVVQVSSRFEYPTDRWEVIEQTLLGMAQRVEALLQERNWGARRVECRLYHESAPATRIEFGLCRPSNSAAHLGALLRAQGERKVIASPVQMVLLRVPLAEPMIGRQEEFFDSGAVQREELYGLIDRLSLRLGNEAVTRATIVPDAQPEYACRFEPLLTTGVGRIGNPSHDKRKKTKPATPLSAQSLHVFVHRPLRLLPRPVRITVLSLVPDGPPMQFCWFGAEYRVACSSGPERIETGWWRGADVRRDYYVVTTQIGTRYWLFRSRDNGYWYLHGCFD